MSPFFFIPLHPLSLHLFPLLHKVIDETFQCLLNWKLHCVKEPVQIYGGLKAVRSCSFHGAIRIKSISLQPSAFRWQFEQSLGLDKGQKTTELNVNYTPQPYFLLIWS